MTKCFGIISWFPDDVNQRKARQDRMNRLLKQLSALWPDVDVLIITQNWKDFRQTRIKNKVMRRNFKEGLGIVSARKTLRKEFLKLNYDYIIMLDDDAIISCEADTAAADFVTEIDKHKSGFCGIHYKGWQAKEKTAINTYMPAQLNLCAISRDIYEAEDFPDIDPQVGQAHEDNIYMTLLHYKYADKEFYPPETIRCTQYQKTEGLQSTWYGTRTAEYGNICKNDDELCKYIKDHKCLPNLKEFFDKKRKEAIQATKPKKQAYGKAGYFLAF